MKNSALLINTARGGLIDEDALYKALKNKTINSAAFDVFKEEPPIKNKLLDMNNFIMSPHIGGSTIESILNMGHAAIEGLDNPQDPINFLIYQ